MATKVFDPEFLRPGYAMAAAGAQELVFDFEFGGAHASVYA